MILTWFGERKSGGAVERGRKRKKGQRSKVAGLVPVTANWNSDLIEGGYFGLFLIS
jgi:hypothetical protein